ncbi:MAG: hypothetical protein QXF12_07715, partial [Candidatus Aenigmatarchaeota archaeon]
MSRFVKCFILILLSLNTVKAFAPYFCSDSDGDCNIALVNQTDGNFEIVDLLTYPFGFVQANFNISLQNQEEIDDGVISVTWYTDVGFGATNIEIEYWNGSNWINCISGLTESSTVRQDECNITGLTKQQ